jgi:hypothetical protein
MLKFVQFYYQIKINIGFYLKELERRRHHRHRTYSPDYHRRTITPSRHRNNARDSTSERNYQTNDSSYSEVNYSSLVPFDIPWNFP